MVQYFPAPEYSERIKAAASRSGQLDINAIIISPGPDLRYLTGYTAHDSERLTALVVPADGTVSLIVPRLEIGTALASPISDLDVELVAWEETEDPYALARDLLPQASRVAVDDRMWAVKALKLRQAMSYAEQLTAGPVIGELRMRKSAREIEALKAAGAAIDRVHERVPDLLVAGRTEREIAADISALITQEHATADFVIVAAGVNSASPHHEPTDKIIELGDVVVVDLGGTTDLGYCSDSTRTYSIGDPSEEFARNYEYLEQAQRAARAAVRPGVSCEAIDAAARDVLAAHGLGEDFIHRTGHGIGMETHEEPYMVAGNDQPLEVGMAFSVEPGFYQSGKAGARLEDIVICGQDGPIVCNDRPRELLVVNPS